MSAPVNCSTLQSGAKAKFTAVSAAVPIERRSGPNPNASATTPYCPGATVNS